MSNLVRTTAEAAVIILVCGILGAAITITAFGGWLYLASLLAGR